MHVTVMLFSSGEIYIEVVVISLSVIYILRSTVKISVHTTVVGMNFDHITNILFAHIRS